VSNVTETALDRAKPWSTGNYAAPVHSAAPPASARCGSRTNRRTGRGWPSTVT